MQEACLPNSQPSQLSSKKDCALGFLVAQCRRLWVDPWSWKIPQAAEQLTHVLSHSVVPDSS